jgi:group I intron endonuclease
MGHIYLITNKINGKLYVGQTVQELNQRLYQHIASAVHRDSLLHRAILKYGGDNFEISELEPVDDKDLSAREKYWINKLGTLKPNGYNINPGGAGVIHHGQETKDRIRNTLRGRDLVSPEARERGRLKLIGIKRSEATKRLISDVAKTRVGAKNAFFGKTHSEETKRRIAEKAIGRPSSKRLGITGYTDTEEHIFVSMTEAYNWLYEHGMTKGARASVISNLKRCIESKGSAYGFHWRFD